VSPGKEVHALKEHGIIVWESGNVITEFNVEVDGCFCVICDGVRVRGEPAIRAAGCINRDGFIWKIDCSFKGVKPKSFGPSCAQVSKEP
jgi:hypothetical protein